MHVWIVLIVLKIILLDLSLAIIEQDLDLFHIDDAIDLTSCEFAESILAALKHCLLVHPALLPIVRNVLFL